MGEVGGFFVFSVWCRPEILSSAQKTFLGEGEEELPPVRLARNPLDTLSEKAKPKTWHVLERRAGAAAWTLRRGPGSLWITGNALLPFPQSLCNPQW